MERMEVLVHNVSRYTKFLLIQIIKQDFFVLAMVVLLMTSLFQVSHSDLVFSLVNEDSETLARPQFNFFQNLSKSVLEVINSKREENLVILEHNSEW